MAETVRVMNRGDGAARFTPVSVRDSNKSSTQENMKQKNAGDGRCRDAISGM